MSISNKGYVRKVMSMARNPREISKSRFYHILVRGSGGKDILKYNEDKEKILSIVSRILKDNLITLYAYCIMDNHAHFVVEELDEDISAVMKRINVSYAAYHNKKHCVSGQVFYDRFKSETIEDFKELLKVMRFIHNNPVIGGFVEKQCDYPWSSYMEYIQERKNKMVVLDKVLKSFENSGNDRMDSFIRYMLEKNNDIYMDLEESVERRIRGEVALYLQKNSIELYELGYKENNIHRDRLILAVSQKGGMSIRKTAEILNLNRGVVYKVLSEHRRGK